MREIQDYFLIYERSDIYRPLWKLCEKRHKVSGTKKCNCPFTLKGYKLANNDNWILQVVCGLHNHLAVQHLEGHSFAGRLIEQEDNILINMTKSEVIAKEILITLKRRDKSNVSIMKIIYNAQHRGKVIEKAEKS